MSVTVGLRWVDGGLACEASPVNTSAMTTAARTTAGLWALELSSEAQALLRALVRQADPTGAMAANPLAAELLQEALVGGLNALALVRGLAGRIDPANEKGVAGTRVTPIVTDL